MSQLAYCIPSEYPITLPCNDEFPYFQNMTRDHRKSYKVHDLKIICLFSQIIIMFLKKKYVGNLWFYFILPKKKKIAQCLFIFVLQ